MIESGDGQRGPPAPLRTLRLLGRRGENTMGQNKPDIPFHSAVMPEAMQAETKIQFRCHKGISCFNACCRQADVTLAPYDILRLKRRLGLTSTEPDAKERYSLVKEEHCKGHEDPREIGPDPPDFSLHRPPMRLKIGRTCPRSPTRRATSAQVRQAPRDRNGYNGWRLEPGFRWALPRLRDGSILKTSRMSQCVASSPWVRRGDR